MNIDRLFVFMLQYLSSLPTVHWTHVALNVKHIVCFITDKELLGHFLIISNLVIPFTLEGIKMKLEMELFNTLGFIETWPSF